MTYQLKPVTKILLAYNPLVLTSGYTTGGGSASTDQNSQFPETDGVYVLADGKVIPEIGKIFYAGDTDIFFYKEKELSTKLEDANGNPFIAFAKDKGEVGSYTGNFFTLRGRLHSLEVLTTKPKIGGGYEQLKAWVGTRVVYQGSKAIEPYVPVWATAENQGQIWSGVNAPATDTPPATETKSSNTTMLIIGAILLYLITKRKKRK